MTTIEILTEYIVYLETQNEMLGSQLGELGEYIEQHVNHRFVDEFCDIDKRYSAEWEETRERYAEVIGEIAKIRDGVE